MERRFGLLFFTVLLSLALSTVSHAREWQIVGPRALGMGGANVAVANDATATYWNPAAYGFFKGVEDDSYGKRNWSTSLGLGIAAQLHGDFGDILSDINDIDFDGLNDGSIPAEKVSDFISLLDALDSFDAGSNKAATVLADARLNVQVGHFGVGLQAFADVSAIPIVDRKNIAPGNTPSFTIDDTIDEFTNPANLGCPPPCTGGSGLNPAQEADLINHLTTNLGWTSTQAQNYVNAVDNGLGQAGVTASDEDVAQIETAASVADRAAGSGPLSQNKSKLKFRGLLISEVPLSYGRTISDKLAVGGNIKFMKAKVVKADIQLLDEEGRDFGDQLDDALDNTVNKSNFGLDLGMLYRLNEKFRVGLVGRNLNSPSFAGLKEKAQLRTGLAYQPRPYLLLAADLDLTKNETSLGSSYKSRNIGAGLEVNLFKILQLRGGVYKNIEESDIGLVYTAGLGLNLWAVNLDLGASRSKDDTKLDGDSVPEEVRLAFALSTLF